MAPMVLLKDSSVRHVCVLFGLLLGASVSVVAALILFADRRPWRFYSWVYARRWPQFLQGISLHLLAALLMGFAWAILLFPMVVLTLWGVALIGRVDHEAVGIMIILAGVAILLFSYALFLWWRTKWQATRTVSILLLLSIILLCSYEVIVVYLTSGRISSSRYSSGGFFFGVSAIAMAVNMLFICQLVFQGNGPDVDEYVQLAYLQACDDTIIDPATANVCPPPTQYLQAKPRMEGSFSFYFASIVVLVIYSIFFGFTAHSQRWLAGVTSVAVIILDANMAACVLSFQLFSGGLVVLSMCGSYRIFLIAFGDKFWYLGHCIAYTVVGSVLLSAAAVKYIPLHNTEATRRTALADTVELLRTTVVRCRQASSASFAQFSQVGLRFNGISCDYYETSFPHQREGISGPENPYIGELAVLDMEKPTAINGEMLGNRDDEVLQHSVKMNGGYSKKTDELRAMIIELGAEERQDEHPGSRNTWEGGDAKLDSLEGDEGEAGESETGDVSPSRVDVEAHDRNAVEFLAQYWKNDGSEGWQQGGEAVPILSDGGRESFGRAIGPTSTGDDVSPLELAALGFGSRQANSSQRSKGLETKDEGSDKMTIHESPFKQRLKPVALLFARSPHRAYLLFTLIFVSETIVIALRERRSVAGSSSKEFLFGVSAFLVTPAIASMVTYIRSLQAENMELTMRSASIGIFCWLLSMGVGLFIAVLSKTSLLLGLAITLPLLAAALSLGLPVWRYNGYHLFCWWAENRVEPPHQRCWLRNLSMGLALCICIAAHVALGLLVSADPLGDIRRHNMTKKSPFATPRYVGWTASAALAALTSGILPPFAFFATYQISVSSAACMVVFIGVLFSYSLGTLFGALAAHPEEWPQRVDLLAAFLPPICVLATFLILCGLYKWKDENWNIQRGTLILLGLGLSMLLLAICTVIAFVHPWLVGVTLLLGFLLLLLGGLIGYRWARRHFGLTRPQTALLWAAMAAVVMVAILASVLAHEAFIGASVALFTLLLVVAGWALKVLLSPHLTVYSPRILPVYVFDAAADKAVDVSGAFVVLYGVAVVTCLWGVVSSILLHPPYAGAAVMGISLVLAYGFAVSRPCTTPKILEDALRYLPQDTVVQALKRAIAKTRREAMGAHVVLQYGAGSMLPTLVSGTHIARDASGNLLVPKEDVKQLRQMLTAEQKAAWAGECWGIFSRKNESSQDDIHGQDDDSRVQRPTHNRLISAHAHILALEHAIDSSCLNMWNKFGGYFLLILGLAARTEKIQDNVRLRVFLNQIGLGDLDASRIGKWTRQERERFEEVRERYMIEKERSEVMVALRRGEEFKGQQRRRTFLEREERKRRRLEEEVLTAMPSASRHHVSAVLAALSAVGEHSGVFSGPIINGELKPVAPSYDVVLSQYLAATLQQDAEQTGVPGAVCIVNKESWSGSGNYGGIHPALCGTEEGSLWADICVASGSPSVCIMATRTPDLGLGLEIMVAGKDRPTATGHVCLRITLEQRNTSEWVIGGSSICDGRWHTVAVTLEGEGEKVTVFVDGKLDGCVEGVEDLWNDGIWAENMEVWVGTCGIQDAVAQEGVVEIQNLFLWGRSLSPLEITRVNNNCGPSAGPEWQGPDPITEIYGGESLNLESRNYSEKLAHDVSMSWRKRKVDTNNYDSSDVSIGVSSSKIHQQPKIELSEEVWHKFRAVELAVKTALVNQGEDQFTDKDFPPNDQSIFIDTDQPLRKLNVVKKWLRPDEVLKNAGLSGCVPELFSDKPNASDVCQGHLGDCWFLSAVAVITEVSRIRDVIITPSYNHEGIYTVRFCVQGEWVPVVVDDWIPCDRKGKPTFATSKKVNEIWVMILEKAYAKLHGSYEALDGGVVQDALVDMTGGAGEEIDMTSAEAQIDLASGRLWTQLLRFHREGFLLGAGSPSGSDHEVAASGIVQGHAYSILQVVEVDGHQLLQVRNPGPEESRNGGTVVRWVSPMDGPNET